MREQTISHNKAWLAFSAEVKAIYMKEGLDYIVKKTKGKITEQQIKDVAAGDFGLCIKGNTKKDKDFVRKFKPLFGRRDSNLSIWHDLLWFIMPTALKQLSKEMTAYMENTKTLPDGSKFSREKLCVSLRITRHSLYQYQKGVVYPNQDTLFRLRSIVSLETQRAAIEELYGMSLSLGTLKSNQVMAHADDWSDTEKEFLAIALLHELPPERYLRVGADLVNSYIRENR